MTIIRLLGENVISLTALNLTELILTYATNSSAVFRNKSDEIKSFIIPFEFFSNEDFELNQSIDEISSSLAELKAIGLITSYSFNSETISFEVVSNVSGDENTAIVTVEIPAVLDAEPRVISPLVVLAVSSLLLPLT